MQSAVRGAKKKINMEIRKSSEERKVLDVSCLLTLETEKTQSHKGAGYIGPSYPILLCVVALPVACNKEKLFVLFTFNNRLGKLLFERPEGLVPGMSD